MFHLVAIVLLFVFVASAVSGLVTFWQDIRHFKSDVEFSGNRRQLIEHLMSAPVDQEQEEVTDNGSAHCDR